MTKSKTKNSILQRIMLKLTSSKLWLTIWACFLITYIVVKGISDFFGIGLALCSIPLSYFAVNEIQKYLTTKKQIE